jgi:hypothetical protein
MYSWCPMHDSQHKLRISAAASIMFLDLQLHTSNLGSLRGTGHTPTRAVAYYGDALIF